MIGAGLHATPLLWLLCTLLVCVAAQELSERLGHPAYAAPPLVAIVVLVAVLLLTRTSYESYFSGARYLHVLLGPATVALAVPMYLNLRRLRHSARALLPALLAGSIVAAASAMLLARLLGAPRLLVLSLGPKSVTTPIAIGISQQIGGQAGLTTAFVMLTAMIGIAAMGPMFRLMRVTDMRAQGLAAGTIAHGLATSRMLLISQTAGAFGGLAIGLNAVVTALLLPLFARLF